MRRGSGCPQYAKYGHFTLLFRKERLLTAMKLKQSNIRMNSHLIKVCRI